MSAITIRKATVNDVSILLKFIIELAVYEKAEHEVLATEQSIKESMFAKNSGVYSLICELDGVAIGSAIYFYNYSTWLAKPVLYLEDLYVSPQFRGKGAGVKLLQTLAKIAIENNCARFEWSWLDWNTPSRDFYHSLGAQAQQEWVRYRMSGQTLIDFVNKE